jgi:undecaprenyl phosphate-alpha-L-ara4FN deformylase
MELGLRIDVDTYRGTRLGVPNLCALLAEHGIRATFFFSVGPDNMGRHLWRLLRPAFLVKMLRTRAASLYGWDILLRGTVVPGPVIGRRLGPVIRTAADAGHEIGFHAWDHHAWQHRAASLQGPEIAAILKRGVDLLTEITGRPPVCSASPAWRCTDTTLLEKLQFPFAFNSDCRGESLFEPVVGSRALLQPQVPTTLPTFDEVLGRNGVHAGNYNDFLLGQLRPGRLNTLTIHAEAEGILCRDLFGEFLQKAGAAGIHPVPLGQLVRTHPKPLPRASIVAGALPGREGWISLQRNTGVAAGERT